VIGNKKKNTGRKTDQEVQVSFNNLAHMFPHGNNANQGRQHNYKG
jgi:hypothetical protein